MAKKPKDKLVVPVGKKPVAAKMKTKAAPVTETKPFEEWAKRVKGK